MNEEMEIGLVVEIEGNSVIVETNQFSNDLTYFYNGVVYRGICVGQFIGIIRGPYLIIGRVVKEYLEDINAVQNKISYSLDNIRRKVVVNVIGYIENGSFNLGIISYPMVYNSAVMLDEKQISAVVNDYNGTNDEFNLTIGKTVKENSIVKINPFNFFNTHIGIFGNTGSGKSNTLAKIYTELFNNEYLDVSNSEFLFIDFNGEYTGNDVLTSNKKVTFLSTGKKEEDKINISSSTFWDIDTLSILFSATEKTQKPFLKNAIDFFLDKENYEITDEKIISGICSAFYNTFHSNNCKETNKLLHLIYDEIGISQDTISKIPYYDYMWHELSRTYYKDGMYINQVDDKDLKEKRSDLNELLEKELKTKYLSTTEKMKIAIYAQLIYGLSYGQVQYEYISPLIERLKSRTKIIDKLINITDEQEKCNVSVISLRKCNTDAKKMIPLLLVKNTYNKHKELNEDGINKSFHLIIDEAHNILSEQSIREESTWKDYRLETFEEIIKEGRKFGYYITLASQRPSDISETIISQLHNYLIHRLVSELDLRMINNTINTLDSVSKSNIPLLSPGQCIITGTSFSIAKIVQITKLDDAAAPDSASANLKNLWIKT